jgi:signal transduction histidine kinase
LYAEHAASGWNGCTVIDIVLETVRAIVLLGIVIFLYGSGRNRFNQFRKGWNLIIVGFGLLLFGSLLDISDNFEVLNPLIIVGDTEVEAFLEKFVGFLGGFVFLAVGLLLWIPGVQELSDLVEARTRDLQETNERLTDEIAERTRIEKIKQEFTATVSHELRTPLTSIKGALSLIRSGKIDLHSDEAQLMLNIACDNSDRLIMLINDLLDMEKTDAGEMVFHMEPLNIIPLVKDAIEANQGYGDRHGITFITGTMVQDAQVEGDKDRLMQVLSNLMSNAAKFSPKGQQVEISTTCEDNFVRIAVKDNGPGIPKEVGNKVFEKFTQVDSSDQRKVGGTGLGLSISKAITEKHGGTIGFESYDTTGATFYFTLPLIQT